MTNNRGQIIGIRLLILRDYIYANASKTRAVTRDDLLKHLANEGYEIERKALYNDLATLEAVFGLELEYVASKRGYILHNPPFEPYELRLMVDSIQASKFITQGKANAISDKIKKLADQQTRATLNRQAYVAGRIRSMNESVVKDADRIHQAIESNKKIGFLYFHYTPDRNKRKTYSKSGNQYIVSPYALYWNNGHYYLYAYDGEIFRYFRVDRMERITLPLPENREGASEYKAGNIDHRKAKVFQMYSGEEHKVKMLFHNDLTDAVIDQFGADIWMIPADSEHFTFTVPVEISPPFFAWIATFGENAKILEPAPVVEEMRAFIERIANLYKNDGEA